jgi:hypothetical protein
MDSIDEKLLKIVEEVSHAPVYEVLKLARHLRSETQLRKRLEVLSFNGLIQLDRTSEAGRVFVTITPSGREAAGRARYPPGGEQQ